jgi:hypothetical protein
MDDSTPNQWRIRRSGVRAHPFHCAATLAAAQALSDAGIDVYDRSSGSAANADAYFVEARFLDGGLYAETGEYWYGRRGAYIEGVRACYWVASLMGLKIRDEWLTANGLRDVDLDVLAREAVAN